MTSLSIFKIEQGSKKYLKEDRTGALIDFKGVTGSAGDFSTELFVWNQGKATYTSKGALYSGTNLTFAYNVTEDEIMLIVVKPITAGGLFKFGFDLQRYLPLRSNKMSTLNIILLLVAIGICCLICYGVMITCCCVVVRKNILLRQNNMRAAKQRAANLPIGTESNMSVYPRQTPSHPTVENSFMTAQPYAPTVSPEQYKFS